MAQSIPKAPTRNVATEMANACPSPDIQTLCHSSRQGVQAAAIGPFGLHIQEAITLLNMSLLIENPDGFCDSNQVGSPEAFGDQCGAHGTPALNVLCAMVIGEALPLPGRRSSTYLFASLKHRDGIA